MLKVVIDGNNKDGWDARVEIPKDLDIVDHMGGLHVSTFDETVEDKAAIMNKLDEDIRANYGFSIFEHELVIIHEDSMWEPEEHMKKEHLELLKDKSDYRNYSSSETLLGAVAQGKVDISTLPKTYPDENSLDEDTLGVDAPKS